MQVRWELLELAGSIWGVVAWAASASSFSPLANDGDELEKAMGWEIQVLVYHSRIAYCQRRRKFL